MDIRNIVNNEYDYSDIIPTIDYVSYLVKYLDNEYNKYLDLFSKDEEKNERLKEMYKEYSYKNVYSCFNIYISEKSYNNIECHDFNSFENAIKNGYVSNVNSIRIEMNIHYKKGKTDSLIEYDYNYSIIFKPYEIIFAKKSNITNEELDLIEKNIISILDKFPKINTIFCTK